MTTSDSIRLGTRASALAQWQANWVAGELRGRGVAVEIVFIRTQGDVKAGPIGAIGGQGVFTKELQRALLGGEIDLAVHSLKDLPTDEVPGLALAAVPPREACGDALVNNVAQSLDDLPVGAVVGTGSVRRQSQLLHARGDLKVVDIRGNVDTRLKKLDDGEYDAIILAEAGLRRLGLSMRIAHVFSKEVMLPAIGQGALGLECRADDDATRDAVGELDDLDSHAAIIAERSLLSTLRGGCLAPIGAWGRWNGDALLLDAVVLSTDGSRRLSAAATGGAEDAPGLGRRVADELLRDGAADMIARSRK